MAGTIGAIPVFYRNDDENASADGVGDCPMPTNLTAAALAGCHLGISEPELAHAGAPNAVALLAEPPEALG